MHSNNKKTGNTKLFSLAISSGNSRAVNHFIELGEDVNAIDKHTKTPLMHAVVTGHINICTSLLNAGADPLYKDKNGDTAISLVHKCENVNLIALLNEFINNREKPLIERDDMIFDFGNDTEESWKAEKESAAPKSDMELIEKLHSNHHEMSAYITIDSDESFDDIDINFPDIFIKKIPKKTVIKEPLKEQLRSILSFGYINGVFHKKEIKTQISKQKILKYKDFQETLEATFSASGIDILDYDILQPFYSEVPVPDFFSDYQVDEMIDFMELELDGYRSPLALFLNEAARYPLLTDEQVKTCCKDIKDSYFELIKAISSDLNTFEQFLNEINKCLRHGTSKEVFIESETSLETQEDLSTDEEIYNISRLNAKELQEQVYLLKERKLKKTETIFTCLVDLVLDRDFLIHTSRIIPLKNEDIIIAINNAINKYLNAKDIMVNSNLRLVYSIAKKYSRSGMPILDLIQDGTLGLMKAVDRFDFEMGNKFSTYATWWIRQSITRNISDTKDLIRIPVHMHESINKLNQAKDYLSQISNNPVSDTRIAEFLEWKWNHVVIVKNAKKTIIPLDEVIDSELSENWDFCIEDYLEVHDPEYLCFLNVLRDFEFQIMDKLHEREKAILLYRSGFYYGEIFTLEKLGEMYDVTRERIRQIEKKGLKKIRNPKYLKQLRVFYPASQRIIRLLEKKLELDNNSKKKSKKSKSSIKKTKANTADIKIHSQNPNYSRQEILKDYRGKTPEITDENFCKEYKIKIQDLKEWIKMDMVTTI